VRTLGNMSVSEAHQDTDPRWWVAPLVTLVAVIPIGFVNLVLLAFHALRYQCTHGGSCRQVNVSGFPSDARFVLWFAVAATVVSLLATTVAAPRPEQPDRRWAFSTVTMLCATSPLLWLLVGAPSF
jgi:hypothetical protein